ncbi:hypothetical protein SAXI111661_20040 [Saccharomonospora xinjiangensis]
MFDLTDPMPQNGVSGSGVPRRLASSVNASRIPDTSMGSPSSVPVPCASR